MDAQDDDSAEDSGAAYLYTRTGTTWRQLAYIKASNTERLRRVRKFSGNQRATAGRSLPARAWRDERGGSGLSYLRSGDLRFVIDYDSQLP